MLALPGAAFVYQGQELGLEEAELRDDERQDPIFARTNGERLGRDGCRVPLPWTDEGRGLGFTTGVPWLPIPEEWAGLSVERQQGDAGVDPPADPAGARAASGASSAGPGRLRLAGEPPGDARLRARRPTREPSSASVNVSGEPYLLDGAELLLASTPSADGRLPADATAWLLEGRVRA